MNAFYDANRAFTMSERVIFYVLLLVAVLSGLTLLSRLNNKFLTTVPDYGGTISEGVVGVPRFINPILALSDPDRDLIALTFSGLLKSTTEGNMVGDLASEYTISPDGRTYTFTLKDDIYFHDGEPITTDDIEFTIEKIQDPTVKSPKRPIWEGVLVKKLDAHRIAFTLKQSYAPFIDNFTLGILPKHIWKDVPADEFSFSELNVNAIGSGPYKISDVERNSYGLPTLYTLRSFGDYALGKPYVRNINLYFYQNETELVDAFSAGDINSMSGVSPENLTGLNLQESRITTATLPRIFGVFFNQNQAAVFLNKEVREALSAAIDKDRIVNEVLRGYGTIINSPVPVSNQQMQTAGTNANVAGTVPNTSTTTSTTTRLSPTDQALAILSRAGWSLNQTTGIMEKKTSTGTSALSFSIATGDAPELKRAAELVKEDWEKIGASVELKVFEISDLNQDVIRPRKFDALLFGEIIGRELDLYPFWHSSQRNDPGLNIALYANISADKILESIRLTQDRTERIKKIREFETMLKSDIPATFIYSPKFVYVIPTELKDVRLGELANPGDRFLNVHEWSIETNKVWNFFIKNEQK